MDSKGKTNFISPFFIGKNKITLNFFYGKYLKVMISNCHFQFIQSPLALPPCSYFTPSPAANNNLPQARTYKLWCGPHRDTLSSLLLCIPNVTNWPFLFYALYKVSLFTTYIQTITTLLLFSVITVLLFIF